MIDGFVCLCVRFCACFFTLHRKIDRFSIFFGRAMLSRGEQTTLRTPQKCFWSYHRDSTRFYNPPSVSLLPAQLQYHCQHFSKCWRQPSCVLMLYRVDCGAFTFEKGIFNRMAKTRCGSRCTRTWSNHSFFILTKSLYSTLVSWLFLCVPCWFYLQTSSRFLVHLLHQFTFVSPTETM